VTGICVGGGISFNFRNILIYGENPLSCIISFNFLSVAGATRLVIGQRDVKYVCHPKLFLLGGYMSCGY
jgi:hypothetical protein